jgi:hypothetical protein
MGVRSLPSLVVLVERLRGDRRSGHTIYGVEPGAVLVESVVEPGRHAFTRCPARGAAAWLSEFADPDDPAEPDGGAPLAERDAVDAAIGVPSVLTHVFAVRHADDDRPGEWEATLAASPSGLWAVVEGEDGSVTGWPLSAADRDDLFDRLLDPERC